MRTLLLLSFTLLAPAARVSTIWLVLTALGLVPIARAAELSLESEAVVLAEHASQRPALERVIGRPCEGCELALERPTQITDRASLASAHESGAPLHLSGRVLDPSGVPAANVILYAYQTDARGIYPRSTGTSAHGTLRGWVKTDAQGRYRFETVRPGGYPGRPDPAHIHMHVIEVGRCTYYIDDVVFADDPRLGGQQIRTAPRGGSGITRPVKDGQGVWRAHRDIELGRNIPGYEQCAATAVQVQDDATLPRP